MTVKLVGKRPVSFKNDKGESISGISLFCVFKHPAVVGEMTDKFFINDNLGYHTLIDTFSPGITIDIEMYKNSVIGIRENPFDNQSSKK